MKFFQWIALRFFKKIIFVSVPDLTPKESLVIRQILYKRAHQILLKDCEEETEYIEGQDEVYLLLLDRFREAKRKVMERNECK